MCDFLKCCVLVCVCVLYVRRFGLWGLKNGAIARAIYAYASNSIVLCEGSGVHGLVRVRLGILGGGGLGGSDGDG